MHQKSCFNLKGSAFTLTVLQLIDNDLECLKKELAMKVEMMPNFFNNTPLVIDLHKLIDSQIEIDFKFLKEIVSSFHMIPVGVKGSTKLQKSAIEDAGLAILAEAKQNNTDKKVNTSNKQHDQKNIQNTSKDTSETEKNNDKTDNPESTETTTTTTTTTTANNTPKIDSKIEPENIIAHQKPVLVKQTVRSGQQVSAPNGDLIIIGSISAGAEILAAGNIHIYGTLRGRALAGIKGDQQAGIFCHNLQAELISIAGIYLLCDDIPVEKMGNSNHIKLLEEKLIFNSL